MISPMPMAKINSRSIDPFPAVRTVSRAPQGDSQSQPIVLVQVYASAEVHGCPVAPACGHGRTA